MSQASVGVDFALETMQYKFASIIGELCGKPSVLSQFAIWLDLRLSEYKLKGSISLDCSGLKPDPMWLQGLTKDNQKYANPTTCREDHAPQFHQAQIVSDNNSRQSDIQDQSLLDVIKKEPLEIEEVTVANRLSPHTDVFPTRRNSPGKNERKRASNYANPSVIEKRPDFGNIEHSRESNLPTRHCSQNNSFYQGIQSKGSNSFENPNPHTGNVKSEYSEGLPTASFLSSNSVTLENFSTRCDELPSTAPQNSENGWGQNDLGSLSQVSSRFKNCHRNDQYHSQDNIQLNQHAPLSNGAKRSWPISSKTARNIKTAVTTFEKWIAVNIPSQTGHLVEIPPDDLDLYLHQFFVSGKRINGQEYTPGYLISFRSHLARYLKDQNYGWCIVTHEKFAKSRSALAKLHYQPKPDC